MDADLYDEFGNYIGPELDSDSDEDVDDARQQIQEAFEYADVSNSNIPSYSILVVNNLLLYGAEIVTINHPIH